MDQITEQSISWAERNGFSHWSLAVIWLVLCITVFQVITGLLVGGGYMLFNIDQLKELGQNQGDILGALSNNMDLLFVSNSTWQILFLAIGTFLFVRLQTGGQSRSTFLRLRKGIHPFPMISLAAVLVLSVQPTIWFLGWINSFLPAPEFLKQLQQMQMDMIKNYLGTNENIWVAIFHIGLVPAICEELLFRGYVLRSFEKSWGIMTGIFVSGFIFGLYHLQLTNLLPLCALGILFAYFTWISGSILPAIAAHFVNNAGSVVVATFYPETAFAEISPETMPPLWAVGLSLIISSYLIYFMYQQYRNKATTVDSHV